MKKTACFFTAITAILLAAPTLYAQNLTARMDSMLGVQARNGLLNGNMLVVEKGKVIYQRSFGFRDIAAHQPNTPESAFALASISKQFTATAVLQLKEKGKLRLDDHFVQYFPDFPFPDITIRQLLNQTSGLPEYELFDALADKEPGRIFTNQDVIPALKVWSKGLYFKPGDDWRYSSMNYCLLALVIEKLSGETLQAYLAKHIFAPAGMHQTYLENLLIKTKNPNRTVNYEYPTYFAPGPVSVDSVPDEHRMIFNMGGFSGQGGLTSTAEDLLRFDNAFFAGKLINADDIADALTPVKLNNGKTAEAQTSFGDMGPSGYGLGWFILNDTTKGKVVWHDGGRPGVSTTHLHNLRTDQTFILLENAAESPRDPIAWAYHLLNKEPAQGLRISLIRAYSLALVNEGADAAAVKLQSLRSNPAYQMPEDWQWVQLSYQLLYGKTKYITQAVEELRTASVLYPDNWYVNFGYAGALELTGKKDLAILLYKKSIAENPKQDGYAASRIKALEAK
jgi:CubicO group peptidase (beta-lactamase class C family)